MTVDSHVHITADDPARYPVAGHGDAINKVKSGSVTGEELLALMDGAGVERAVLVQASHTHGFDNSYAADMAAAHHHRFSSVCIVDTAKPDAPERLEYWIRERGMDGLRLFSATTAYDPAIDDPRSLKVMEKAHALGIPVTVVMCHDGIGQLCNAVRRFPDLPVIVDHLVRYPVTERPPYVDSASFLALADYPNVSLKYSTVNQWALRKMVAGGSLASERDYFKSIVDRFGAGRLMWGSNYPVTRYKPYEEMRRMGEEPFDFLAPEKVDAIMGGNALRHFWRE